MRALSPPPPVSLRIGESDASVVKVRRAVSAMWTSVYVDAIVARVAETFTTSTFAPLKARRSGKPCGGKELHSSRSKKAKLRVVKVQRS